MGRPRLPTDPYWSGTSCRRVLASLCHREAGAQQGPLLTLARRKLSVIDSVVNIEAAMRPPAPRDTRRGQGAERWPSRPKWCLTPGIEDIRLTADSVSDTFAARRRVSRQGALAHAGAALYPLPRARASVLALAPDGSIAHTRRDRVKSRDLTLGVLEPNNATSTTRAAHCVGRSIEHVYKRDRVEVSPDTDDLPRRVPLLR